MTDNKEHKEIEKGWDEMTGNPWLIVFVIFFLLMMGIPLIFFCR